MATLVIRNLSDDLLGRLEIRAARNGRSIEAEARTILEAAVAEPREPSAHSRTGPISVRASRSTTDSQRG
jgi:plasmid stability protein